MGPLGVQEMVFIFLLALVLFGPKKLPELGRMLARGISEFRRAQGELKATFDRELRNLERDESLKDITNSYRYDTYNYDYSSSDTGTYNAPYSSTDTGPLDSTAANTDTTGASATEGAASASPVTPEGAVAHETGAGAVPASEHPAEGAPRPKDSLTVEHNA